MINPPYCIALRVAVGHTRDMAATGTRAPFTASQSVEVAVYDFTAPGQPLVWVPATVTGVERREDGKFEVSVSRSDGGFAHQVVGPRGGNRRIRAAG